MKKLLFLCIITILFGCSMEQDSNNAKDYSTLKTDRELASYSTPASSVSRSIPGGNSDLYRITPKRSTNDGRGIDQYNASSNSWSTTGGYGNRIDVDWNGNLWTYNNYGQIWERVNGAWNRRPDLPWTGNRISDIAGGDTGYVITQIPWSGKYYYYVFKYNRSGNRWDAQVLNLYDSGNFPARLDVMSNNDIVCITASGKITIVEFRVTFYQPLNWLSGVYDIACNNGNDIYILTDYWDPKIDVRLIYKYSSGSWGYRKAAPPLPYSSNANYRASSLTVISLSCGNDSILACERDVTNGRWLYSIQNEGTSWAHLYDSNGSHSEAVDISALP